MRGRNARCALTALLVSSLLSVGVNCVGSSEDDDEIVLVEDIAEDEYGRSILDADDEDTPKKSNSGRGRKKYEERMGRDGEKAKAARKKNGSKGELGKYTNSELRDPDKRELVLYSVFRTVNESLANAEDYTTHYVDGDLVGRAAEELHHVLVPFWTHASEVKAGRPKKQKKETQERHLAKVLESEELLKQYEVKLRAQYELHRALMSSTHRVLSSNIKRTDSRKALKLYIQKRLSARGDDPPRPQLYPLSKVLQFVPFGVGKQFEEKPYSLRNVWAKLSSKANIDDMMKLQKLQRQYRTFGLMKEESTLFFLLALSPFFVLEILAFCFLPFGAAFQPQPVLTPTLSTPFGAAYYSAWSAGFQHFSTSNFAALLALAAVCALFLAAAARAGLSLYAHLLQIVSANARKRAAKAAKAEKAARAKREE